MTVHTQVAVARVSGPSCGCGCASLALVVDHHEAPAAALREFSGDSLEPLDQAVGFRVLLEHGYLADVEIFGYGDADADVWPSPDTIH